ncbi:unnamed protein product [Parajaminaea phylloscopi]
MNTDPSASPQTSESRKHIDTSTSAAPQSHRTTQHGYLQRNDDESEHSEHRAAADEHIADIILPPSILDRDHPSSRKSRRRDAVLKHAAPPRRAREHDFNDGEEDDDDEEDASQTGSDPQKRPWIDLLPEELVGRVFQYLDPASLARCAGVCKQWAVIVKDDATWRRAFACTFGASERAVCLRRTTKASWKSEFIRRTDLLRRWRKSKSPAITTDMRVTAISSIAFSPAHNFMLSASVGLGVASRADPFKGKVARGVLDAAGILANVHNAGAGEVPVDVTALDIASDASSIAWGSRDGSVAATLLLRQGSNPRGLIKSIRFSPRGAHVGQVTCIAFDLNRPGQHRPQKRRAALGEAADIFVTGGQDGQVKLWSPQRALPLWTGSTEAEGPSVVDREEPIEGPPASNLQRPTLVVDPVTRVDVDADRGVVAAGTQSGQVYVWRQVDVKTLLASPSQTGQEQGQGATLQSPQQAEHQRALQHVLPQVSRTCVLGTSGESPAIAELLLDASESCGTAYVLALRSGQRSLQYAMWQASHSTVQVATLDAPSDVVVGKLTCIRAEFCQSRSSDSVAPSPMLAPISPALVLGPLPGTLRDLDTGRFAEQRFVCAGTDDGKVLSWRLPSVESLSSASCPLRVSPSFALDCHHTPITSIDFTPHLLAVGCADGTIRGFDALSGELIRTWNDRTATRHPARMLAAGELTPDEAARFRVKQIIVGEESILAAVGPHVLAWRAEAAITGRRRNKVKLPGLGGSGTASGNGSSRGGTGALGTPLSKYAQMREMRNELAESSVLLQAEKEQRLASYEHLRFARGSSEQGGLTEQEALEYALMLSRDDEEARLTAAATAQSEEVMQLSELARIRREEADLQDALERVALAQESDAADDSFASSSRASWSGADDESLDHNGDYEGADLDDLDSHSFDGAEYASSSRRSPAPLLSPSLVASTSPGAWNIIHNAGSATRWHDGNTRWGDASKVRTVAVPRSARHLSGSQGQQSQLLSPSSLTAAATPAELNSPEHWPTIASSSVPKASPSEHPSSPFALGPSRTSQQQLQQRETPDKGKAVGVHEGNRDSSPMANAAPAAPAGAWARGKPSISKAPSWGMGSPSAASSPLPWGVNPTQSTGPSEVALRGDGNSVSSGNFDEDLRFAIELSLAEEKSRQQQQAEN